MFQEIDGAPRRCSPRLSLQRWCATRAVALFALVLAISFLAGAPSPAEAAVKTYPLTATVNVRATPSTTARATGKVFKKEKVKVLCQDEGSTVRRTILWDYIEYNVSGSKKKKRGYVSDYYVKTGTAGRISGVPYGNCRGIAPKDPSDQSKSCASSIVKNVRVYGYGRRVVVSMEPTRQGRKIGAVQGRWQPIYKDCVAELLPARLTKTQLGSLEKQFYCHDSWDMPLIHPAGPTWDLESWRRNPSWDELGPREFKRERCDFESDGPIISLNASNYPGLRMTADKNAQAVLRDENQAGEAGRFRLVLGLGGTGYSFQKPGTDLYLRHQNGRLMLQLLDNREHGIPQPLYALDGTFVQGKRSGEAGQYSYRSYNFPEHYIRHYMGGLEIGTPFTHRETPFTADHWFIRTGQ